MCARSDMGCALHMPSRPGQRDPAPRLSSAGPVEFSEALPPSPTPDLAEPRSRKASKTVRHLASDPGRGPCIAFCSLGVRLERGGAPPTCKAPPVVSLPLFSWAELCEPCLLLVRTARADPNPQVLHRLCHRGCPPTHTATVDTQAARPRRWRGGRSSSRPKPSTLICRAAMPTAEGVQLNQGFLDRYIRELRSRKNRSQPRPRKAPARAAGRWPATRPRPSPSAPSPKPWRPSASRGRCCPPRTGPLCAEGKGHSRICRRTQRRRSESPTLRLPSPAPHLPEPPHRSAPPCLKPMLRRVAYCNGDCSRSPQRNEGRAPHRNASQR